MPCNSTHTHIHTVTSEHMYDKYYMNAIQYVISAACFHFIPFNSWNILYAFLALMTTKPNISSYSLYILMQIVINMWIVCPMLGAVYVPNISCANVIVNYCSSLNRRASRSDGRLSMPIVDSHSTTLSTAL